MSPKLVRTRTTAEAELQQGVHYYVSEGAFDAAEGLTDEFERALSLLAEHPGIGSARFEADLGIPGVRTYALPTFVDVRHLLHSRMDIPRRLAE